MPHLFAPPKPTLDHVEHGIPLPLVNEVNELKSNCLEIIPKGNVIWDKLATHGLAYELPQVLSTDVITHPDNRSRLVLNPKKAHRVLVNIKTVGSELSEFTF